MGNITLNKALDDYKNIYMPYRNFSQRTMVEYINDLEKLLKYLNRMGIDKVWEVTLPHLVRCIANLES